MHFILRITAEARANIFLNSKGENTYGKDAF